MRAAASWGWTQAPPGHEGALGGILQPARIPMLCAALVVAGAAAVGPANADPAQLQAGAQNSNGCYIPERVAHRLGAAARAPSLYYWENSWKAYERSSAAGVKIFETDVR